MEIKKTPKKQTWMGEKSVVYEVPISIREYHLRLEQMMETIYSELSQLSHESKILGSSSSQLLTLIQANPEINKSSQGFNPDGESRSIAQEAFDGVA